VIAGREGYPRDFVELEALSECNTCSSRAIAPRYAADLWACADCGVLFRNPRPSFREIVRSYDSGITYAAWQREDGVRARLWAKRLGILLRHKRAGALLDVGTGDGRFLDLARAHFQITSTEVSEAGARHARARGHDPLIGPVLGTALPEGYFDVITMWHVLEHVLYPGQALVALRRALKPDGVLAIAVPNETAPLVLQRLPGRSARHPLGVLAWGHEIHLTHFVPSTLRGLLRRLGFRILEMGVDDVHVERPAATVARYQVNRLLNALAGFQFDKAMYVICTRDR
jgi:2-polyprenyl-3-methyl-5-hydroxy-6-metoxy-1,4-benzoquinol methylase